MKKCYIVRYGELALKGKNRIFFEKCLEKNIKDCLSRNNIEYDSLLRIRGRIFVFSENNCDILKDVFGIVSISPALQTDFQMDNIKACIDCYLDYVLGKSFRIRTQRADKNFAMESMVLDRELGAYVVEKTAAKVRLDDSDIEIGIEIFEGKLYVFVNKVKGHGGMPLGTGGKVLCLSDDENTLLAAWMIMRRGTLVEIVGRSAFDISFLKKYDYGTKIILKRISNLQQIEEYAQHKKIEAIVSSQTLKNFTKLDTALVVLRPLIIFTDEEISTRMDALK